MTNAYDSEARCKEMTNDMPPQKAGSTCYES